MEFYGKYAKVRNSAWKVLLDQRVDSLPVRVSALARRMGIRTADYQHAKPLLRQFQLEAVSRDVEGIAVCVGDRWYILYDPEVYPQNRIRFTLAHELGHILLGHEMEFVQTEFFRVHYELERKPERERQADMFASRLLAPACVLAALNLHTPEEIMRLYGLTYTAAKVRADRMEILYQRNKFGTHPLERKLMKQFAEFVENQEDAYWT